MPDQKTTPTAGNDNMREQNNQLNIEKANQLFDMSVKAGRLDEDSRDAFIKGFQNPDNASQYFDKLVKAGMIDSSVKGTFMRGLYPGMFENTPFSVEEKRIPTQADLYRKAERYQRETEEQQQKQSEFERAARRRMQLGVAASNLQQVSKQPLLQETKLGGDGGLQREIENAPTLQERLQQNQSLSEQIDKELKNILDEKATKEDFESYIKNPQAYAEKQKQGLLSKEQLERNKKIADLQNRKKALDEDTRKLMARDFQVRIDDLEANRIAAGLKTGRYTITDNGFIIDNKYPIEAVSMGEGSYAQRKIYVGNDLLKRSKEYAEHMSDESAKSYSENDHTFNMVVENLKRALRLSQLDNDAGGWSKFWSGIRTAWNGGRILPYINLMELVDLMTYRQALERVQSGNGTESDKELIASQLDKDTAQQLYNDGYAGKLAQGLLESLSFMADMAIGGKIGSFLKLGKGAAKGLMKAGVSKGVIRAGERLAAQTATLPLSAAPYVDIERRQIENYQPGYDQDGQVSVVKSDNAESVGSSVLNAFAQNLISRSVETVVGPVGEKILGGIGSGAKWLVTGGGKVKFTKDALDAISKFLEKSKGGLTGEAMSAFNMQNFGGEMVEEIAEEPLQRLLVAMTAAEKDYAAVNGTNRWSGMYDKEFWEQTAGSIGLMQLLFRLPGISVKGTEAIQNANGMRRGLNRLNDRQKQTLKGIMKMDDDNQRAIALSQMMNGTTEDERRGIVEYVVSRVAQNMATSYGRAYAQQNDMAAYRNTLMQITANSDGNALFAEEKSTGNMYVIKNVSPNDPAMVAYPAELQPDGTYRFGKPRVMDGNAFNLSGAKSVDIEELVSAKENNDNQINGQQDQAAEAEMDNALNPDVDSQKTYVAGHEFNYTDPKGNIKSISRGSRIVPIETIQAGAAPETPVQVAITKPGSSVSAPGVMTLAEFQDMVERGYISVEEQNQADAASDVMTDESGNPVAEEEEPLQQEEQTEAEVSQEEQPAAEEQPQRSVESTNEETQVAGEDKIVSDDSQNGIIGRSATEEEAAGIIAQMEANAEVAPEVELTPENWTAQFGENGEVQTPIGTVKMGEGQYLKLARQGRESKLGMIKPTLENPDIIIEDNSQAKEGQYTERPYSYVFVKSFTNENGERKYLFTSVTVQKDRREVSISSQEKEVGRIKRLMKDGRLAYIKKATLPPESGSSIQGNQSAEQTGANLSINKGTQVSEENQVRLPENPVQTQYESLLAENEGDEAEAVDTAKQMIANKQSELEQERKKQPKGKTVEAIQEAKRAKREKIAALENEVKFWQDVASYPERKRQAEEAARKIQRKIDAQQRAEKARRENPYRLRLTERDKALGEPLSVEEYVLRRIATGATKFRWNGENGTGGLKEHGGGNRYMIHYVDKNTGKFPEVVADDMVQDIRENHPELGNVTASDILNIIEGIAVGEQSYSDLMTRAEELHNKPSEQEQRALEEAKDAYEEEQRREAAIDEGASQQAKSALENLSDKEYNELNRPQFVGEMFDEDGTPKRLREKEVEQTASRFPNETAEEAAAFDRRIPDMSNAELIAYIKADGNGDITKAHHPALYDEYDYRFGKEILAAYDDCMKMLRENNATVEQAQKMLDDLRNDQSALASDKRAGVLGQEEALEEYIDKKREADKKDRKSFEDHIKSIGVKVSPWPKGLDKESAVEKVQKSGKHVNGEKVAAAFVGENLHIRSTGFFKGSFIIPNAKQYGASDIALRIEEGIAITVDAARLLGDAIRELYSKNGLPINSTYVKRVLRPLEQEQTDKGTGNRVLFRRGGENALSEEERGIVERAKAEGTYMKAPNGKPTRLTPKQWVQVRTKAFKKWFGDWEKAARIEKLRNSKPIEITGNEIEASSDLKQYKKNALEYGKTLRGEYTNKDTGSKVSVSANALKEVLQHDGSDIAHIQSVAAIQAIIENGIYIDTVANEDTEKNTKVIEYQYYVVGLKIGNVDYTVKSVIAVDNNGNRYYDHALTRIEKGNLLNELGGITNPSSQEANPLSGIKDKRLISILQTDASKVVDENGEPLVVYHGTLKKGLTEFREDFIGSRYSYDDKGFFFISSESIAKDYSVSEFDNTKKGDVIPAFLSLKKPLVVNSKWAMENGLGSRVFKDNDVIEFWDNYQSLILDESENHDGVVIDDGKHQMIVAFSPTQIKSATDNVGAFDSENPDIRFRNGFQNGLSGDEIFDLLSEQSDYGNGGASRLISDLEKHYGGELESASSAARSAMESGLVPFAGNQYAGKDSEYHHMAFIDENGERKVVAVPFTSPENLRQTKPEVRFAGEMFDAKGNPIVPYSKENSKFASSYETAEGKTIRYTSEKTAGYGYGDLFDFDYSGENERSSNADLRTGTDVLQREENPGDRLNQHNNRLDSNSGEFCVVERIFTESGSFNFTSGEKIESADDVAFIFSSLEDAAKEHSFVVFVNNGKPTVVELGMGTFSATLVDAPTVSLAYSRIRPDQVYFVHNHPSGQLVCSPQDMNMLDVISKISDVPVLGVIINLKTGKYGTFDKNGSNVGQKRVPEKEYPLTVHTLDKQIFSKDYDPMEQPLVKNSKDVAQFLNSQRMGDRAKISFLILSRAGRIVGNIHTPFTKVTKDVDTIARYIAERVIQFGGDSAILYGDFDIEAEKINAYQKLKDRIEDIGGHTPLGGPTLLDVVRVEGNRTISASDNGMLNEPAPMISKNSKREAAEALSRRLGIPVKVEDRNTPKGRNRRFSGAKGWFVLPSRENPNGAVHVNIDNHTSVEDVERTILHEVVGHMGMRKMLGEEKYNELLDRVYDSMDEATRAYFEQYAAAEFDRKEGMTDEEYLSELRRIAADEYIAGLAEVGTDPTTWQKIVSLVRDALRAMGFNLSLSDADIRALLYESRHNLEKAAFVAERELFRQNQEAFRAAAELSNRIDEDIRMRRNL